MRPLQPEFVTRRVPWRRLAWGGAALGGAALLAVLWTWRIALQAERLHDDVVAASNAAPPSASPAAPVTAPYVDSARELLAEQTTGWQTTLLALERTALTGVTPVSIELQARERTARVEVEFSEYAVLMRYLDRLNAGSPGAEWSLTSAQRPMRTGGVVGAGGQSTATLLRRW